MEDPTAVVRRKHAELTDEERWDEGRTGWAPRFEQEKGEAEEDEPTLLDHQTWIESKLDDKYFGGMNNDCFYSC